MERHYYLEMIWPLMELHAGELELAAALLQECLSGLCRRHHGELLTCALKGAQLRLVLRMPVHIAVSRFVLLLKISSGAALGRRLGRGLRWPKGYQLRSLSAEDLLLDSPPPTVRQQNLFEPTMHQGPFSHPPTPKSPLGVHDRT